MLRKSVTNSLCTCNLFLLLLKMTSFNLQHTYTRKLSHFLYK